MQATTDLMRVTVYSVTPNDDRETPCARVFGSEKECLEFVFDRLDIPEEDHARLSDLYELDEDLFWEELNAFYAEEYDSYAINSHDVLIPAKATEV